MKKICSCCGQEKDLDDFYKHKEMLDGHLNKCKDCKKNYQKAHRLSNLERVKKYDRNRPNADERSIKRRQRLKEDPEKYRRYIENQQKWRKNNRHKANAHSMVKRAIQSGKIQKPTKCQKCGNKGDIQAHHPDYSKPLEVIFLCNKCHKEEHKKDNK